MMTPQFGTLSVLWLAMVACAPWNAPVVADQLPTKGCPESTRPHASRCDQYFRCATLPSKTHVWITTQCSRGLIYNHRLGTCVVPDNDWECNPSVENQDQSDENVYGIENLPHHGSTTPKTSPVSAVESSSPKEFKLPTIAGDSGEGIYIIMDKELSSRNRSNNQLLFRDDLEYSGDGSFERLGEDYVTDNSISTQLNQLSHVLRSEQPAEGPVNPGTATVRTDINMNDLTPTDLNSFLAEYNTKSSRPLNKSRLPLPPDGKIHPEHLSQILTQQKKLNKIATRMKQKDDPTGGAGDRLPFTNKQTFLSKNEGSVLFNVPSSNVETSKAKVPYMSEDIIRSILEISKQMMMATQKPPTQEKEAVEKPIFIPISVNAPPSAKTDPKMPENSAPHGSQAIFNAKPIAITFTNPYNLGHAAIFDNMKQQVVNDSLFYDYQTNLFDSYGNKYIPKETFQLLNHPNQMYPSLSPYAHPQQQIYQQIAQQPGMNPQVPMYPNVMSYLSPQAPQAAFYNNPQVPQAYYGTTALPPISAFKTANDGGEYQDDSYESMQESVESSDVSDNENLLTSSLQFASDEHSSNESIEEAYQKKLISIGGSTFDYQDYKESFMPLLDANPNDVRISVLTCTAGARQPNQTDCFKYYVCNPSNKLFQSFTCPAFTAFNKASRLCDTASYKPCQERQAPSTPATPLRYKPSSAHTNILKQELLTAHKYVELIKQEANKLLTRNNLPQLDIQVGGKPTGSILKRRRRPSSRRKSTTVGTTTAAPTTAAPTTVATTKRPKLKKAPRCRYEGRMPDPNVRTNYYVCSRSSPKKFIKMKMACPMGLIYCSGSQYCTLERMC